MGIPLYSVPTYPKQEKASRVSSGRKHYGETLESKEKVRKLFY